MTALRDGTGASSTHRISIPRCGPPLEHPEEWTREEASPEDNWPFLTSASAGAATIVVVDHLRIGKKLRPFEKAWLFYGFRTESDR